MTTTYENILEDVSYALIERFVNTPIAFIDGPTPGTANVGVSTLYGIYVGAMIFVGTPANIEVVTVTALGFDFFTATFANAHASNEPIFGATFPSGQSLGPQFNTPSLSPLFTQAEIIGYINDAQSDFLLAVRPLYEIVMVAVTTGQRFYQQPADCIRLERIAINPNPNDYNSTTMDLLETAQTSLDLTNPTWMGKQGLPSEWFRDESGNQQYGYSPLPSSNVVAELWYSQNNIPNNVILTTPLLVPDAFAHVIKYSVLAKCWTKDGETRDPKRAEYCERRVKMITMLAVKFMTGAGVNMPQGTRGDLDFAPMPLQKQGA